MSWIDKEFKDLNRLPIFFVKSVVGNIEITSMDDDGCCLLNSCELDGDITYIVE